MKLLVSWRNAAHFLLQNPTISLVVDGVSVPATMKPGAAEFILPSGGASPPNATLVASFAPSFTGTPAETLRIEQHFALLPPLIFGGGGPRPTSFSVRPTGASAPVTLIGQHPLLLQSTVPGIWFVFLNTNTVDVTTLQPLLLLLLGRLTRPSPASNVRVLARTDGRTPLHWLTATPASSASAPSTDVLCFLTPPQGSAHDRDDPAVFTTAAGFATLAARLAVFLAEGKHDDTLPPRGRDHFARARNPADPGWTNQPIPSVVIPRGWEAALIASGKHVALALPVPSDGSHNDAATVALPARLLEIHATLVAIGDIAAADGSIPGLRPQLGVAAHSNGGASLFSAVEASSKAFQEIWLFDTNDTAANLPKIERSAGAQVLFAGYDPARVVAPFAAALKIASLSGRVRRLPDPPLASTDTPATLAASSTKLTHALEGGGVAAPASSWTPGFIAALHFSERFEVLHQQIVQGNDADGAHFLTKALAKSVFS